MRKKILLLLGPLLCLLISLGPIEILNPEADKVLGVAVWMILWWITEAVSISVTALIPLCFYPLLGIMPIKEVSANYSHPIVFLFFGGFILALALEKVNLHRRIALNIIKLTGTRPDRVVLGFIIATALLSMWISNTATAVVMLPIAYSVIDLLTNDADGYTKGDHNFSLAILLGIAYAANVGGMATLIGTPPNLVLAAFMENEYGYSISFVKWMMVGLPVSLLMLGCIYLLLTKILFPNKLDTLGDSAALIETEIEKLGKISKAEIYVSTIFCVAIFFWIFKNNINEWFPELELSDTTISMVAAFSCFVVMLGDKFILDWEDTKNLPWGIIILFGGGLSLASGMYGTGIVDLIGEAVSSYNALGVLVTSIILISVTLFMTELISNVALVNIFAPMVAGVAIGMDIELLHILIPVAMASSCAFMLPMSTPPNAIVFASGKIKVVDMVKAGVLLNLIAIALLILFYKFVIPSVF